MLKSPHVSTSPVRLDNSQDPSPEIITKSGKRRKIWEPSDLDSTLAGQRETLSLSPVVQQLHHRHLFSPGEQREEPRCQDTSIADSPHMIINQEFSDTIQSLPWAEQETLQSTKKISSLETNNTDTDEEDQDTNRSPNPLLSSSREELEASIITASDFW